VPRLASSSCSAAAGRLLGVLAALSLAALWAVFLFRNPYAASDADATRLVGYTMIAGAAIAAAAAARGAYVAMYLLFFVMFVPVGFYVLLTPGMFSAIGWIEIGYLAAAILVHLGTPADGGQKKRVSHPVD